MAIPHAVSGEVVDVRPLDKAISSAITHTIIRTDSLEVIRIVLHAGNELPPHRVPGEITVQCLEGNVTFRAGGVDRELSSGQLLYLDGGVEHALRANTDSSLLVTLMLKPKE